MIITQDKVLALLDKDITYTPEEVVCLMFPDLLLNIRTKLTRLAVAKRIERKMINNKFVYTRVK